MTSAGNARAARVEVLVTGYTSATGPGAPNAGTQATITYIRDGDRHFVVDPGMVASRTLIHDALASHGLTVDDVTDVILSHHHPDNIMNVGLFPNAWVHDQFVSYRDDQWEDHDAEGRVLSDSVTLIRTPGHSPEGITALVGTPDGVVAIVGDLWWWPDGPVVDPVGDMRMQSASRRRVLELADVIVPGHGPAFTPDESTPR